MNEKISVTCPHCGSTLKIDVEAGVVIDHAPPVHHVEKVDFDERLQRIESERARAADRMAEAMRREQSRDRIMEDRFRELLDDAKKKDDGKRPLRDIDLD
jgi:Zn-finger nucleic acid-binding protein